MGFFFKKGMLSFSSSCELNDLKPQAILNVIFITRHVELNYRLFTQHSKYFNEFSDHCVRTVIKPFRFIFKDTQAVHVLLHHRKKGHNETSLRSLSSGIHFQREVATKKFVAIKLKQY